MTRVWHGSTTWNAHTLAEPRARLYVTDTPEKAQLYADAQATESVSDKLRFAPASVVIELETSDPLNWRRRSEGHNTLDTCEAVINNWTVINVTARFTRYSLEHGVAKYNGRYSSIVNALRETYGDKLTIIEVE